MKKVSNFFKNVYIRFKNNWFLKIVSLILAVILWNSVIVRTNPMTSRTTAPLPVTIIGADQLNERNLALTHATDEFLEDVRVTIAMTRSQSQNFDESSIQVTLDLSKITKTGQQELKLSVLTNQGEIERLSPKTITIDVDKKSEKIIPIDCTIIGEVEEGYFVGEVSLEPNIVQISGPEKIISQIERASVEMGLSNVTESIIIPKYLTLVDSDGEAINASALTMSVSSVLINLPITPRKELLVIAENAISGKDKLTPGYQLDLIEVSPSSVEVTGPAELINGMTSIATEIVDVAGHYEDVTTTVKLLVPSDVILLDADTVSLVVRISEILENMSYKRLPVEIRNVPEGMSIEAHDEIFRDVSMLVPFNTVSTLSTAHIKLYIDLEGTHAGTYEMKIECDVPEEFRAMNIVVTDDVYSLVVVED